MRILLHSILHSGLTYISRFISLTEKEWTMVIYKVIPTKTPPPFLTLALSNMSFITIQRWCCVDDRLSQQYKRKYWIWNRITITQLITKSEGEEINFILRLILQEGGRMGQEDSINHHWDSTLEKVPKVFNLVVRGVCPEPSKKRYQRSERV